MDPFPDDPQGAAESVSKREMMWRAKRLNYLHQQGGGGPGDVPDFERDWTDSRAANPPPEPCRPANWKYEDTGATIPDDRRFANPGNIRVAREPGGGSSIDLGFQPKTYSTNVDGSAFTGPTPSNYMADNINRKPFNPITGSPKTGRQNEGQLDFYREDRALNNPSRRRYSNDYDRANQAYDVNRNIGRDDRYFGDERKPEEDRNNTNLMDRYATRPQRLEPQRSQYESQRSQYDEPPRGAPADRGAVVPYDDDRAPPRGPTPSIPDDGSAAGVYRRAMQSSAMEDCLGSAPQSVPQSGGRSQVKSLNLLDLQSGSKGGRQYEEDNARFHRQRDEVDTNPYGRWDDNRRNNNERIHVSTDMVTAGRTKVTNGPGIYHPPGGRMGSRDDGTPVTNDRYRNNVNRGHNDIFGGAGEMPPQRNDNRSSRFQNKHTNELTGKIGAHYGSVPGGGSSSGPYGEPQRRPSDDYSNGPSNDRQTGLQCSSNAFASRNGGQNVGNVLTDKPTTRVVRPPGGTSSIQLG